MRRDVAQYPYALDRRTIVVADGTSGAKSIAYPIEDAAAEGGEAVLNRVLEVRHRRPTWPLERSNRRITPAEIRTSLAEWRRRGST
ncbi:hypothetical protein [Streptomyces sp. NPDC055709]